MKTETSQSRARSRKYIPLVVCTLVILMVPFVAMQFTDEVNWGIEDFVTAAALLLGTGLLYEFIANRLPKRAHRVTVGAALVLILVAVWAELAVGILE